jgi:hypothetical protein
MRYSVEYFNQRVLDDIEAWPVGVLANYVRLVELLMEFGPNCTRKPWEEASSSSELSDAKALAAPCTAT